MSGEGLQTGAFLFSAQAQRERGAGREQEGGREKRKERDFILFLYWGFPGGSSGQESVCQCKRCRRCKRCGFDPWVGKTPWRSKWQPTPVFLPGKSNGQRNLEGYSLWDHKELDMTE